MSLVLSLCATTIPPMTSAVYTITFNHHVYLYLYSFTHLQPLNTHTHSHTCTLPLSIFANTIIFCIYCTKPACTSRPKQRLFNATPSGRTDAPLLSFCGRDWDWGPIRAQSPPALLSGVSEVSVDEKATCHFGSGNWIFFNPPLSPLLVAAGPTLPRQDHGE